MCVCVYVRYVAGLKSMDAVHQCGQDIPEVQKYAGRQLVYTSASEQCNSMAVT